MPQDERFFGKAMEERGIAKKRTSAGMVFENLRLKNDQNGVNFNFSVPVDGYNTAYPKNPF